MATDQHARIIESLPAYALGCLDREEGEAVASHLASCSLCRAELAAFEGVVGRLPYAVPDCAPPPALKQAVMARVQARAPALAAAPPRGQASWLGRALPLWAAVSAVLVLALAVSNLFLWQQLNQLRAQAGPMRTVALVGTEVAPGAAATLVVSADGRQGALVVDDMPPLEGGKQYQLWLIEDGRRTSGGVFSVDEHGYGMLWVSAPRPLSDYSSFGVTVEPAGGSPGPTGQRVLAGRF